MEEETKLDVDIGEHKRSDSKTAEQKQIKFEHDIKVEDEVYANQWKSCCFTMDKRPCLYFTQIFIICAIMSFNIYQLIKLPDPNSQVIYMSLLTFLLGVIIPSPKM